MTRTASAQDLLAAAARATVNSDDILQLLARLNPDAVVTGTDVAEALPSTVTPEQTRRRLPRDPEVAE